MSGIASVVPFGSRPTLTALIAAQGTFVLCLLVAIGLAFVALRRIVR